MLYPHPSGCFPGREPTMRYNVRLVSVVVIVAWAIRGGVLVAAEPPEVQQAREVIKDNGRSIVYFALPTYKYVSTGYNDYRRLSDGYELTFTFESKSFWRTNTTRIAFYIDQAGRFDYCKMIRSTTYYTPFADAVGNKELKKLRAFMEDYPAVRDSRKLLRECDEADAKGLCELFLKLEQAKRDTTPTMSSAGKKEPLSAAFAQVAPVPERPTLFERGVEQKRAVILIHGYRPEFDRFLTARAVLQDWQEPDSFMVQILKRDADVYAFAYGQNATVREVAEAPELAAGVARLRSMGYTELVLLGHSGGGLVCRHFVENHAGAGITKVVQVCTPNAGSFWAHFGAVACSTQRPYVDSLKAVNCRPDSARLPEGVEFICVVGDAVLKTDWVVTCRSQWSDDLQNQGVPAVRLHVSHSAVVEMPESIGAIARAVREPAPRWDRNRVQLERVAILKE
jgi:pimeloyl-ACP methyl ester carboxylesterase